MRVRPRGEGREVRACDDEGCPCETPYGVEDCCRVRTCMCAYVGQERAWAEGSRGEARGGMPVPDGGGVRAAGGDRGLRTGPSTVWRRGVSQEERRDAGGVIAAVIAASSL